MESAEKQELSGLEVATDCGADWRVRWRATVSIGRALATTVKEKARHPKKQCRPRPLLLRMHVHIRVVKMLEGVLRKHKPNMVHKIAAELKEILESCSFEEVAIDCFLRTRARWCECFFEESHFGSVPENTHTAQTALVRLPAPQVFLPQRNDFWLKSRLCHWHFSPQ